MQLKFKWIYVIGWIICCWIPVATAKINIVAAENIYGELAKQLGNDYVEVRSILNNPAQDPHLFSAVPSIAKAVADADLIIYNGADYDNWMQKLLAVKATKSQRIIVVADLVGAKPGMNPHLWYDPATMPLCAKAIVKELQTIDKTHRAYYAQNLSQFTEAYQVLPAQIYRLRLQYLHTSVSATEPVFGYMTQALGMQMHSEALQWNVMNGTSPSPAQLRTFEDELKQRQVRLLIYNKQVSMGLSKQLQILAQKAGIPVVGVTEMQPQGMNYIQWMQSQLNEIEQVLNHG